LIAKKTAALLNEQGFAIEMERASNAMKFSTLILKKVKTNRTEAVLDVFPKQPFSCACPKGYVGKV
jgi:hypothetical protein